MIKAGQGRLNAPPLAHLDGYKSDVVAETALAMHAFDLAHAVMLVETGIIRADIGAALLSELLAIGKDDAVALRTAAGGGNHAGERLLTVRLGQDIGGYLGLARSSGDLSAVSIRLYLRGVIQEITAALDLARSGLLDFADLHAKTLMPGTTHGQHAQPTTLAHWALMFETAFARDQARFENLYDRVNRSPAGAAIMTGSDFPVDRQRVAQLLGFDGVLENTMDAILSHDIEMEFVCDCLVLTQTLARLADDLMLWSTFEYGFVELPDWFCGTSSIMPQKKNPDGLEDFKSLASEALGVLAVVVSTERGPTGFPMIERRKSDMTKRRLAQAIPPRLRMIPDLFSALVVDAPRMAASAGQNWAQVTDMAALLVREGGLDWRSAHHLVGVFIRECLGRGVAPADAQLADLKGLAKTLGTPVDGVAQDAFAVAMDPRAFVARRQTFGGPAPEQVARALARARRALAEASTRNRSRVETTTAASSALHRAAEQLTAV